MKKVPLWAVFVVLFIVFFGLCALLLTDFPSTPGWAPGATHAQMFWGLCRMNAPVWAVLSALGSGAGTGVFALVRRKKEKK